MPAYKFTGIKDAGNRSVRAEATDHETGKTTSFNHELFEGMAEGTDFVMDRDKSYPQNPVTPIAADLIPGIIEQDKCWREANRLEYERKKAENIATGRFSYSYSPFRDRQAETIIETLSTDHAEFWEVACCRLNLVVTPWRSLAGRTITAENLAKDEHMAEFFGKARPGDTLQWYSWDGGPMAYAAGLLISRDGAMVAKHTVLVS